MMPGVGHLPYEEAPEEFNRVLLEFLAQQIAISDWHLAIPFTIVICIFR